MIAWIVGGVAVIALAVFVFLYSRRSHERDDGAADMMPAVSEESSQPAVVVSKLPATVDVKPNLLHEITDKNLLSRFTALTPAIVNALGKTQTLTTQTTTKVAGDFYQVVLAKGGSLVGSKSMPGAFRGITKEGNHIKEMANLVKVQPTQVQKVTQTTQIATSAAANVMNVASLVVGQYYMTEINGKLEKMDKSISEISDYQKREFKSRLQSLVVTVQSLSKFSQELFEDKTIRNNKLLQLQNLSEKATEFLSQVNLELQDKMTPKRDLSYKEYTTLVNDFESLIRYQQILLALLQKIGELTLVFGNGKLSNDYSYSLLQTYEKPSLKLDQDLVAWHHQQMQHFAIDLDQHKRHKDGIQGAIAVVTGVINKDWHYTELDPGLADKIEAELAIPKPGKQMDFSLYGQDVQLMLKGGKTYLWLPEAAEK
ncbi:EGFR-like transmembrane domain-containing protein [Oenococcus sp.]|uniref:EGFR-like transmembrane domain-containing protein n=1 Tax=Oenococcus sp. TaxID=1979414 RepID=UPI0039E885D2